MRLPLIILFLSILMSIGLGVAQAQSRLSGKSLIQIKDPFQKKKSDTAIKPFVFPKSMKVVQSCSNNLRCIFHNPKIGLSNYYEDTAGVNPDQTNKIFSDKTRVKKTLLKIDPARIAPVFLGADVLRPPDEYLLYEYEKENKKNEVDFILYFRITFNHKGPDANIFTEGRIFLTRQKKTLVIPPNRQSVPFKHASIEHDGKEPKEKINVAPDVLTNMKNLMKEAHIKGLKQLAKDARKVIHSHKYEKRHSNY